MTCIVGLVDNGKVYIGGDSAGVSNYSITKRKDKKVFVKGEFAFGFTSSFRMGQILRYSFNPPEQKPDQDIMEYMCVDFINALRKCLKDGGFATIDRNEESGGTFLVGYKGRLFCINNDYQVEESLDEYNACGCGMEYALGSLSTTNIAKFSGNYTPQERVTEALYAASKFSTGVCPPFNFVEV